MSLHTEAPWDAVAEGYDALVRPSFGTFAHRAIELAQLPADARVLDVATGPATLPLLVADRVHSVVGIDFSPEMLRIARHNVRQLDNVTLQRGDGQHLTYEGAFDAAFSLFGLMFFPDRAAGLRSLYRALVPGGRAVISAWPPPDRSTGMLRAIAAVTAAFPDAPKPPPSEDRFDSADALSSEMRDAGFTDVRVVEAAHRFTATPDEMWRSIAEGFAPLALARKSMPREVWAGAEARGTAWLREHHDADEELTYTALLAVGGRP